MDEAVEKAYLSYPPEIRNLLMQIRKMIFDTAKKLPEVGEVEESLKWGQPTYTSRIGTPIRLGLEHSKEDKAAVYVHCQTSLISDFRVLFSQTLNFSKNRAILIDIKSELPLHELSLFIEKALCYHSAKYK